MSKSSRKRKALEKMQQTESQIKKDESQKGEKEMAEQVKVTLSEDELKALSEQIAVAIMEGMQTAQENNKEVMKEAFNEVLQETVANEQNKSTAPEVAATDKATGKPIECDIVDGKKDGFVKRQFKEHPYRTMGILALLGLGGAACVHMAVESNKQDDEIRVEPIPAVEVVNS